MRIREKSLVFRLQSTQTLLLILLNDHNCENAPVDAIIGRKRIFSSDFIRAKA